MRQTQAVKKNTSNIKHTQAMVDFVVFFLTSFFSLSRVHFSLAAICAFEPDLTLMILSIEQIPRRFDVTVDFMIKTHM